MAESSGGGGGPSIGGMFRFAGALTEGIASYEAHQYNADIATMNAGLVREQALAEVERIRRRSVKDLGDMRASYGAQGVTASGSVLDAIADAATQYELDAQLTKWQGEVAAISYQNQANAEDAAANGAAIGGAFGAVGALLG